MLAGILKVLVIFATAAGAAVGFAFLCRDVPRAHLAPNASGELVLINPPKWLNEALKVKIGYAVLADGEDLKLDDDAARSIQRNLTKYFVWLAEPRVQVTSDSVEVRGVWRRPVAMITINGVQFLLDSQRVVLDYVDVPALPLVEIKGIARDEAPALGETVDDADITSAMDILIRLARMDRLVASKAPLLSHIAAIDMGNSQGRRDGKSPHITLYSEKGTAIIWGAELGAWSQYLEATDEEKLAKLYGFYRETGSLDNGVKYINLSDPRGKIPLPIDR